MVVIELLCNVFLQLGSASSQKKLPYIRYLWLGNVGNPPKKTSWNFKSWWDAFKSWKIICWMFWFKVAMLLYQRVVASKNIPTYRELVEHPEVYPEVYLCIPSGDPLGLETKRKQINKMQGSNSLPPRLCEQVWIGRCKLIRNWDMGYFASRNLGTTAGCLLLFFFFCVGK